MGELEKLINHFEKKLRVVVPFLPTNRLGEIKRDYLVEELAKYSTEKKLEKQQHESYLGLPGLPKKFLPKPKSPVKIFKEKYEGYDHLSNKQLCVAYCKKFGKSNVLGKKKNKQIEFAF